MEMELREGSRRLIKSTYGQRSETQDSSLKLMSSDTNSYKTMETIKRSMVVRGQRRGTGRAELPSVGGGRASALGPETQAWAEQELRRPP